MARCGCSGGTCPCSVQAGTGVTVSGSGTTANPFVVSADIAPCTTVRGCLSAGSGITYNSATGEIAAAPISCADVRPCISAAPGLTYNSGTGVMGPDISNTAGNSLVVDPGGLYVPATMAVATLCGLTGDGSPANPLGVATATWPFTCGLGANGGGIYCDTNTGQLKGEPMPKMAFFGQTLNTTEPAPGTLVPAATTVVDTVSVNVTNPDPCRDAFVIAYRQIDVDLTLPSGASATIVQNGDAMSHEENTGTTQQDLIHHQTGKISAGTLAAGASTTFVSPIALGQGVGGARWNRVQADISVWLISLPA